VRSHRPLWGLKQECRKVVVGRIPIRMVALGFGHTVLSGTASRPQPHWFEPAFRSIQLWHSSLLFEDLEDTIRGFVGLLFFQTLNPQEARFANTLPRLFPQFRVG